MTSMSKEEPSKRLPVFVFPEELKFQSDERKQVLTLYNPYDVTLSFKILSNVPQRYTVMESQGVMKPHCCVDIVIRHLSVDRKDDEYHEDKFRVDFHQGTKLIGRKQVPVRLVELESNEYNHQPGESTEFKDIPIATTGRKTKTETQPPSLRETSNGVPSVWMALIGMLSLIVLLLPLENESSSWPSWIHVTVSMKLMAAFVLGLTTMVILKS